MRNIQTNSDNTKLINSDKKTPKHKKIDKNLLSKEMFDSSILDDSKKTDDSKQILLNTLVNITVELGKSKIKIKDFLNFSKGSMLILDKTKNDPLDIFINGHLIASGEIVFSEKQYGLRITSIKNSFKTINVLSKI